MAASVVNKGFCEYDESQIETLRNMNTVLMYVIMGLVCRFKALGGSFRNLKFDLLYKYIYTHNACNFKNLKLSTSLGFHQNYYT